VLARSLSADVFTLNTTTTSVENLSLDESNIAWSSDDEKFKQPSGFKSVRIDGDFPDSCSGGNMPSGCQNYTDPKTNQKYLYYYPQDSTVQYLYESYPDQISPIDGVTDEHFKVWMRPAALPRFRKLYGTW
jgi:hypothetical protein